MVDDNELERIGSLRAPAPGAEAKARALAAAMQAFDEKNFTTASQGSENRLRLTDRHTNDLERDDAEEIACGAGAHRAHRFAGCRLRDILLDGGIALQFRRQPGNRRSGGAPGRNISRTCEGEEGRRGNSRKRDPIVGAARTSQIGSAGRLCRARSRTFARCQRTCRASACTRARGSTAWLVSGPFRARPQPRR